MPWGRYKGTRLGDIPPEYWRYLWNDGMRKEDTDLGRYLRTHAVEIREQDEGKRYWVTTTQ